MKKAFITLLLGLSLQAGSALAKPGDSQVLVELERTPNAMTTLNGMLYVSTGKSILQIDKNGKIDTVPFPQHWDSIREITELDGKLYCLSITKMFEVEPGKQAKPFTDQFEYASMTSMGGKLYLVSSDSYKLFALGKDAKATALSGPDWGSTRGIASMNGMLYILTTERLHAVDAKGKAKVINGPVFNNPTALAAGEGKLYVASKDRDDRKVLYEIEPNGKRRQLALPDGVEPHRDVDVTAMTFLDGNLYMSVPTVGASSKIFSLSIR